MADFAALAADINELADDLPDVAHDAANEDLEVAQQEAKRHVPEYTRQTKTSIRIEEQQPTWRGSALSLVAGGTDIDAPPAFVEYGTGVFTQRGYGSGKPDWEDILDWIVTKGIQPRAFETRRDLAWYLATEWIPEMGTRPHPFMRPAWRGHETAMPTHVGNAINGRVRRIEATY